MATVPSKARRTREPAIEPLRHGERLTQPEFHRRYEAYPDHTKFELIGGTVYLASPERRTHGRHQGFLVCLFAEFETATPGVEFLTNATMILDKDSEPEPDAALRILPEFGGQSSTTPKDYVEGAAELMGEVAYSTVRIDLHQKKDDYQRTGVIEYIVVSLPERRVRWFELQTGQEIQPDPKGVYRSKVFPGLWIDGAALLAQDHARLLKVLKRGLASPEHAAFVKRLQARRRKG